MPPQNYTTLTIRNDIYEKFREQSEKRGDLSHSEFLEELLRDEPAFRLDPENEFELKQFRVLYEHITECCTNEGLSDDDIFIRFMNNAGYDRTMRLMQQDGALPEDLERDVEVVYH